MKLIQIWEARPAWIVLNSLNTSHQTAYRIAKCVETLAMELRVIDAVRQSMVRAVVGVVKPTVKVSLTPDTDEYREFEEKFFGFLKEVESDFEPFYMDYDYLVAEISTHTGNEISDEDLTTLRPFFNSGIGSIPASG